MSTNAETGPTLSLKAADVRSVRAALALYQAAVHPEPRPWRAALKFAWTAAGLPFLLWLAWAEPFSVQALAAAKAAGVPAWIADWLAGPAVFAMKGVLFVEAFGYMYHRWFQHVGWLTRRAQFFRRNQKFHWIHHMVLYPIGRYYKRDVPYVSSEGGYGLSWLLPGVLTMSATVFVMGLKPTTGVFIAAAILYAMYPVDRIHEYFHLASHPLLNNTYYHWLEKIHILHHWDQRTNFTIVHPFMDWLFGTYLSPRKHERELAAAMSDEDLTVSDLINWRYLLTEATPAEYAAFISMAKKHPRGLRKIGHLMEVLHHRLAAVPDDSLAKLLRGRAVLLLNEIQVPA